MGLIRRVVRSVRRGFRRVTSGVKGAFNTVTKGVTGLTSKALGFAGKILDKLPFGNVIKGFVQQFMNNPLALLSLGGMGGLGALASVAMNPAQLSQMSGLVAGTQAFQHPLAQQNMAHLMAFHHASMAFRK